MGALTGRSGRQRHRHGASSSSSPLHSVWKMWAPVGAHRPRVHTQAEYPAEPSYMRPSGGLPEYGSPDAGTADDGPSLEERNLFICLLPTTDP